MHIGIDAHAIGAQQGGNETYIRNLISALAEIDQSNQYTIYFCQAKAADQWQNRFANFAVRLLPAPTPLIRVPVALDFELRKRPVDVLHVQFTAPLFCPAPIVTTIHDLAFEHHPETFTRRGRMQLKLTVRNTTRRAAHILTVSEFSRQDIIKTYGVAPEKITVTHNGCNGSFSPHPASANETSIIKKKFGIVHEYLLALGSLQPRKNLIRLLRAYTTLRKNHPDFRHQLVLVGRQLWLSNEIMRHVQHHEFAEDIIVTGYADDDALPALYRSATALVYPSLFEGFGLPPLEAMACGTPVITSNNSSLPEVIGEAGVLVDALDENSIGQAILQVCTDAMLRNHLSKAGLERAQIFSWREAARETLAVYQSS